MDVKLSAILYMKVSMATPSRPAVFPLFCLLQCDAISRTSIIMYYCSISSVIFAAGKVVANWIKASKCLFHISTILLPLNHVICVRCFANQIFHCTERVHLAWSWIRRPLWSAGFHDNTSTNAVVMATIDKIIWQQGVFRAPSTEQLTNNTCGNNYLCLSFSFLRDGVQNGALWTDHE